MLRTVWRGVLVTKSGAVEAKVQVDGKALLERNKRAIEVALSLGLETCSPLYLNTHSAIVITLDPSEESNQKEG